MWQFWSLFIGTRCCYLEKQSVSKNTMKYTGNQQQASTKKSPISILKSLLKLLRDTFHVLKFLKRKVWNKLSIATSQIHHQLSKVFEPVSETTSIIAEFSLSKALWTRSIQANHFSGDSHLSAREANGLENLSLVFN